MKDKMADIVERLRAYSNLTTDGVPLYDEAADEIERLTAGNAEMIFLRNVRLDSAVS